MSSSFVVWGKETRNVEFKWQPSERGEHTNKHHTQPIYPCFFYISILQLLAELSHHGPNTPALQINYGTGIPNQKDTLNTLNTNSAYSHNRKTHKMPSVHDHDLTPRTLPDTECHHRQHHEDTNTNTNEIG